VDVLAGSTPAVPPWNGAVKFEVEAEEEAGAWPGEACEEAVEDEGNPRLELFEAGDEWCGCRKWGCPSWWCGCECCGWWCSGGGWRPNCIAPPAWWL